MIAPGLKPVGWVAAVATAALGCYMLSLNVASERSDLDRIEHQIVTTKQAIRALQTELGTRGRLAQLEQWNGEVLALAAPTSHQFLDDEMKLARFDRREPTLDERAPVRMATAETGDVVAPTDEVRLQPAPARKLEAPVVRVAAVTVAPPASLPQANLVHRASLEVAPVKQPQTLRAAIVSPIQKQPQPLRAAIDASIQKAAPSKPLPVRASKGLDGELASIIGAAARAEARAGRK